MGIVVGRTIKVSGLVVGRTTESRYEVPNTFVAEYDRQKVYTISPLERYYRMGLVSWEDLCKHAYGKEVAR